MCLILFDVAEHSCTLSEISFDEVKALVRNASEACEYKEFLLTIREPKNPNEYHQG